MAKQKAIEKLNITLQECIDQLQLINANIFMLKQGVAELIEQVEAGNLDHAIKVIEIFKIKQTISNLTPEL